MYMHLHKYNIHIYTHNMHMHIYIHVCIYIYMRLSTCVYIYRERVSEEFSHSRILIVCFDVRGDCFKGPGVLVPRTETVAARAT